MTAPSAGSSHKFTDVKEKGAAAESVFDRHKKATELAERLLERIRRY